MNKSTATSQRVMDGGDHKAWQQRVEKEMTNKNKYLLYFNLYVLASI